MVRGFRFAIGGIATVAVTLVAVSATRPDAHAISQSEDIVPSMALEQSVVDILPAATIGQFEATGINTKTARLLGKSATLSYYATSKGNDKICVIAVTPNGTGNMMACTLVKGFEEYGLRVSSGDLSEGGWLVAPNTTQIAQERDTENRWEQAANNFLTR